MSQYLKPDGHGGLTWGPLAAGRLVRRYKRFLADVELENGEQVTAHTANTGRMTGCAEPGRKVWLSLHEGSGRKYPYSWEMIEMPGTLVGVNTMVPNRLVAEAAAHGLLTQLPGKLTVEREVTVGHSRLDLRLTDEAGQAVMVEIKNCTLAEPQRGLTPPQVGCGLNVEAEKELGGPRSSVNTMPRRVFTPSQFGCGLNAAAEKGLGDHQAVNTIGYFPDAVTARGSKHLDELASLSAKGLRAAVFILVQRGDAEAFSPADHIDPEWGRRLRAAMRQGVEVWAWRAALDLTGIRLDRQLPVIVDAQ